MLFVCYEKKVKNLNRYSLDLKIRDKEVKKTYSLISAYRITNIHRRSFVSSTDVRGP